MEVVQLTKDHFAYIGIHREALDELQQLKNELWKIILYSKSENSVKIATVKELHNLVKTKVLILRDFPFITRISKYYDLTLFDNSLVGDKSSSSKSFKDKNSGKQHNYNAIKGSHLTDYTNTKSLSQNYLSINNHTAE